MRAAFREVLHVFLEVLLVFHGDGIRLSFLKLAFAAATSSFSCCMTALSSWHLLLPTPPLAACLLAASSLSSRAARLPYQDGTDIKLCWYAVNGRQQVNG
jgi:hypothetical protein